MAAFVLGLELILVFVLTLLLLHHYGNWRTQHVIVTLAVFVAWYFSFLIVFIIPMDVSSTLYQQCLQLTNESYTRDTFNLSAIPSKNVTEHVQHVIDVEQNETEGLIPIVESFCEPPWSYVPSGVLETLWLILYWTCQVLTWLVLPLMQSYAMAGEFSVVGKLMASVKRNLIYYGTYLLIFGILLIYVAAKPELHLSWNKLYTLLVTASNTWGLFLLILLLGYGLVEIPRSCWRASSLSYQLAYTQFKLAKASLEKSEADEELEDVFEEIRKASEQVKEQSPLRKCLDLIISKCPDEFRQKLSNAPKSRAVRRDTSATVSVPTESSLVVLHKRLIASIHRKFRTSSTWFALLDEGFELEDCIRNQPNADKTFRPTFPVPHTKIYSMLCSPTVEWFWKCVAKQWLLKFIAVLIIIFSAMVVWSECTFFVVHPVLSIFANFVQLAGKNREYFNVELASFFIIAFLSLCTYYTVFKIRVFNYYHLAPRHQTDENSLIFCGTFLCRLTPPMCLNFLGLIHLDSHVVKSKQTPETAFTKIMGHMDVLPLISDGFNIYFPILIIILCLATYFRLGTRILNFFGFQQFVGEDDMAVDFVNDGRELMQRERRRRLRAEETRNRRDQLMELVNNTSNFGRVSHPFSREHTLSKGKPSRDGVTGSGSAFRYRNFQNDEPTAISDFQSSSSRTDPQLRLHGDRASDNDSGVHSDRLTQDLSSEFRSTDRNYQATAQAPAAPSRVEFRYPPQNLFDDV